MAVPIFLIYKARNFMVIFDCSLIPTSHPLSKSSWLCFYILVYMQNASHHRHIPF